METNSKITVKGIKGFEFVDIPIVHRDLGEVTCDCYVLKNPIGNNTKITFSTFNCPKNYLFDKMYELQYISKIGFFRRTGEQYVCLDKINTQVIVLVNSDLTLHILNNKAYAIMNINHESEVIRFLSNFVMTFEIANIIYM